MDAALIREIVEDLKERERRSSMPVPVGVSNRHLHLTGEHFRQLFGREAEPSLYRQLRQPGFFACNEKVSISGPSGSIDGVRLIGPCRAYTQVEVSRADAVRLGLKPPIRDSGDLEGSAGIRIDGPAGSVTVGSGVILSKRHIHFTPADAARFGLKEGSHVRVLCGAGTDRETIFERVLCRVSDKYALELHLDIEEANAAGVRTGDSAAIV